MESDSPRLWRSRPGAILTGSLAGLVIAFVVAALMVVFVPDDETAEAGDDTNPDVGATPTTDTGEAVAPNFSGEWISNFSTMQMTQQGDEVSGTYVRFLTDKSPRTLTGAITDRTLDGTFDGTNPLRFQMANDSKSFMGHWADPQGNLHEWCGAIDPPLPDGCGYSGEWRVKNFPPVAALEGDSILMAQYGDRVEMRFDSSRSGEVTVNLTFDGTTLALATGTATLAGGTSLQLQFLVTEDPDWNILRGTWRSGNESGAWCAAQGDFPFPC